MGKNPDNWEKIERLIEQDKQQALDAFRDGGFTAEPGRRVSWKWRPLSLTAAALAIVAIGLAAFWLAGGFSRGETVDPLAALMAESILYNSAEPTPANPAPAAADSPFNRQFAAVAGQSGLLSAEGNGAAAVDTSAFAVDSPGSAAIERGDPEAVAEKLRTMIRENAFERVLSRFAHTTKEV